MKHSIHFPLLKLKNKPQIKLYSDLKKLIHKTYGPKCKDFYHHCIVCQAYMALDIIEDLLVDAEIIKERK